jgi:thiamine biosynthesis lipoprotein ApbE
LLFALGLACGGCRDARPPTISRAWPELGTMMSAAAWGADSSRVARALQAASDSVDRIDSLVQRHTRIAVLDSVARDVSRRTGARVIVDSIVPGYALDRAAGALSAADAVDSVLLDLGGQYVWIARMGQQTRRVVGIPDPDNSLRSAGTVELRAGSIHTKLRPPGDAGGPASVTVLAPTALDAIVWSNAFFAMGCDSALSRSTQIGGARVSIVCVDSSGVRWTPDLERRVIPKGGTPQKSSAAGRAAPAP